MGNASKKINKLDSCKIQYNLHNSNAILIGCQQVDCKAENTDIMLVEKFISNINKNSKQKIDIMGKYSFIKEQKQQQSKYELIGQIKDMFNTQKDVSLIYFSGSIDPKTSELLLLIDNKEMRLSYDEIVDLWQTRHIQQKLLFLIIDANYSGLWVQKLKKSKHNKFIAIQASTSDQDVISQPKVLKDTDTNFSYFTEDLVNSLSQLYKVNLNLKEHKKNEFYNPSFHAEESVTATYSLLGLPIFFQSIEDMENLKNFGNPDNFTSKDRKKFITDAKQALNDIKGGKKESAELLLNNCLPKNLTSLFLYNQPKVPLYAKLDMAFLVTDCVPETKSAMEKLETNDIFNNKIGLLYYHEKAYNPCLPFFLRAVKLKPSNFTHAKNVVQNYSNLKQESLMQHEISIIRASKHFSFQQKNELEAIVQNFLCIKYNETDIQKSIEHGEKAVELNNTSVAYFKNLMKSFVKLDMYDAAVAYYESSKDRYKGDDQESIKGFVHNQIGVQLYQKKNYKEALIYFEISYQQDPKNVTYCKNVIDSMKNENLLDEAIQFYTKAIYHFMKDVKSKNDLDVKLSLVYNLKGVNLYKEKKYEEALPCFVESFKLYNTDMQICKNLLQTQALLGRYKEALNTPELFKNNQIKQQEIKDFAKQFVEKCQKKKK